MGRRERRTRDRARWGRWSRRGRMEKGRGGQGGIGRREDEDIYLAASTVLKTTVVHFAGLPRGTSSGSCDGG